MAETMGKIFTKEEEKKEFGSVSYSVEIKTSEVKNLVSQSPENIMFKFLNPDNLVVLNKQRKAIFEPYEAKSDEVFHNFSTSVLTELLEKEENEGISFQMRGEKFCIENGNYLMELSYPCPPWC